jgi:hypothetical protein
MTKRLRFNKKHIQLAYEAGWDSGYDDSLKSGKSELTFKQAVDKLIEEFKNQKRDKIDQPSSSYDLW